MSAPLPTARKESPGAIPDRVALLRTMLAVRAGDLREEKLLRQGRGWIHIPGQGHETLAAIAAFLEPGDLLFPYYRDRALFAARGVSALEMARDYLATVTSSTGGRMMPVHGSYRRLGIYPPATPTASQCLPAVGAAWALALERRQRIVLTTVGDASVRQGEFFEALALAVEMALPVVFVVEDNGYGISTPTRHQLPMRIGLFAAEYATPIDGRDVDALAHRARDAVARARAGGGPSLLWVELDRLTSHTNSDDHRVYRSAEDIAAMRARDPVERFAAELVSAGALAPAALAAMRASVEREVDDAFARAESESAPGPASAATDLVGPSSRDGVALPFALTERENTIAAALHRTLGEALDRLPATILFGEDVEDPKGGVFGFTKGLSTRHPGRVRNAPLAEATIVGAGVGLAAAGLRPIVELQFIDFAAPALNQLANQLATLRWRSRGEWTAPLVLYAPHGAYLPAGSAWHSQSNEGWWTHIPGLRVAVPSTPADAAAILWTALNEHDPTLILIPKHVMRLRQPITRTARGFGRARVVRRGKDVTLVGWGNGVEIALAAADALAARVSVEVIDPVSLVPFDWEAVEASVARTGRLVVIDEDARTGCFGQTIVAEMVGRESRFAHFLSAPRLVARTDGHVPYHPDLESAVLPDVGRVCAAIEETLA
ncbi:2-oxoisovalerate dehydrogenase E1 component [Burkholderiales bacterium]|nr:2-oxoisovalerate dehydrogenase E1 component [Burkholderiales bacterium]